MRSAFSSRPTRSGLHVAGGCVGLLVVITALRIAVSNPIEAVGFLYVLPISIAAVEFGWRGGLTVATAALALTALWGVVQDVPLGALGYGVRAAMFGGLGALVGLQAEERGALLAERERLVHELRATAMHDQLTGLANRRAWDERLKHELRSAARTGAPLSIAVLDIDHFKLVNDTYGHAEGDRLIERCASGWRFAVRETDFVARLGGDEFFALLPDCPEHEAVEVARRMLDVVPPPASVSLGLACWNGLETDEALIARADRAMYDAKAAGGAQIAFAADPDERVLDPSMAT